MSVRIVIVMVLFASVIIGATLPVGAQEAFISPVKGPVPPVPTPVVWAPDLPGDAPVGHHDQGDDNAPMIAVVPVASRLVYVGQPFGWVVVDE